MSTVSTIIDGNKARAERMAKRRVEFWKQLQPDLDWDRMPQGLRDQAIQEMLYILQGL